MSYIITLFLLQLFLPKHIFFFKFLEAGFWNTYLFFLTKPYHTNIFKVESKYYLLQNYCFSLEMLFIGWEGLFVNHVWNNLITDHYASYMEIRADEIDNTQPSHGYSRETKCWTLPFSIFLLLSAVLSLRSLAEIDQLGLVRYSD